jgi:peptidoglycan-N-acetylglucosamine deacetylase
MQNGNDKNFIKIVIVFFCLLIFTNTYAIDVAMTVDDLPGVGELPPGETRTDVANQMLAAFQKHHLQHVYGMVIGGEVDGGKDENAVIQQWLATHNYLGNHTFNHFDLDRVSSDTYINDIQKNENYLASLKLTSSYKYFRYPYLAEGNTKAKRDAVRAYLNSMNYQIAPVTIDFPDYEWNKPYAKYLRRHDDVEIARLKQAYLDQALDALNDAHEVSNNVFHRDVENVMLVHIGAFEAMMMDDLLTAYEQAGVKFVDLPTALTDPIYQINPNIESPLNYAVDNRTKIKLLLKGTAVVNLPEEPNMINHFNAVPNSE